MENDVSHGISYSWLIEFRCHKYTRGERKEVHETKKLKKIFFKMSHYSSSSSFVHQKGSASDLLAQSSLRDAYSTDPSSLPCVVLLLLFELLPKGHHDELDLDMLPSCME